MPNPQIPSKQTLTIIVVALTMAVFIYIGMTYIAQVPTSRPVPPMLRTVFWVMAVVTTVLGPLVERKMLEQAKGPAGVQTAVIVAGALAEVSAILGLMVYFISGQRDWVFFILSLIGYARLLLRLPEYHRLMDEKSI